MRFEIKDQYGDTLELERGWDNIVMACTDADYDEGFVVVTLDPMQARIVANELIRMADIQERNR